MDSIELLVETADLAPGARGPTLRLPREDRPCTACSCRGTNEARSAERAAEVLAALRQAERPVTLKVVIHNREAVVELTPAVFTLLRTVLRLIAKGSALRIEALSRRPTVAEVAKLLGVPRTTLRRRLRPEDLAGPFRLRPEAFARLLRKREAERRRALGELVREAQDLGFDDRKPAGRP